ncbi:MAG: hypothetical protein ACI3ZP_05585 [Candidatus Cryptobacteroides sp.]
MAVLLEKICGIAILVVLAIYLIANVAYAKDWIDNPVMDYLETFLGVFMIIVLVISAVGLLIMAAEV